MTIVMIELAIIARTTPTPITIGMIKELMPPAVLSVLVLSCSTALDTIEPEIL